MKIIIAPDSFKGSLSAVEVCAHIEKGVRKALPGCETVKLPVSDGGEGLVEVMVSATKGSLKKTIVQDPLGRKIEASYGILGNGHVAVIEMAAASGLPLLKKEERQPLITTTYGTGQLIKAALEEKVDKIIVGIGGSATVDGGTGMATSLGARFLDSNGNPLVPGGGSLDKLEKIDISGMDPRIRKVSIEVACDVDNPLTGNKGAARVYAPQKGADAKTVEILEKNLSRLAERIRQDLGIDVEKAPGSGAAGGLGAGLMAFMGGKLLPGTELVLENINFENHVRDADLVITGEGKIDHQTFFGKVPVGVSIKAAKFSCPVIAIGGCLEGRMEQLHSRNISSYFSIINSLLPEEDLYRHSGELLELCAEQVMRTLELGKKMTKT